MLHYTNLRVWAERYFMHQPLRDSASPCQFMKRTKQMIIQYTHTLYNDNYQEASVSGFATISRSIATKER
jgi:hypothetical protein